MKPADNEIWTNLYKYSVTRCIDELIFVLKVKAQIFQKIISLFIFFYENKSDYFVTIEVFFVEPCFLGKFFGKTLMYSLYTYQILR